MTFGARGVGVGASGRGGLSALKRNMPYALVELGPARASLKVTRKSCTPSSPSKNKHGRSKLQESAATVFYGL